MKRGPKIGSKNKRQRLFKSARGESGRNKVFLQYKANAKIRYLMFCLSKSDFEKLTSDNCHYCGAKPINLSKPIGNTASEKFIEHGTYIYNGIDRINSSYGYFFDNCVTCCKVCNYMKHDMDYKSFKKHIIKIYNHLSKEI